jgi:hypothetical protein
MGSLEPTWYVWLPWLFFLAREPVFPLLSTRSLIASSNDGRPASNTQRDDMPMPVSFSLWSRETAGLLEQVRCEHRLRLNLTSLIAHFVFLLGCLFVTMWNFLLLLMGVDGRFASET